MSCTWTSTQFPRWPAFPMASPPMASWRWVGRWEGNRGDPGRRERLGTFLMAFKLQTMARWWFQIFFIFTSTWGNDPIWRACFSDGLVQPPPRWGLKRRSATECGWRDFPRVCGGGFQLDGFYKWTFMKLVYRISRFQKPGMTNDLTFSDSKKTW